MSQSQILSSGNYVTDVSGKSGKPSISTNVVPISINAGIFEDSVVDVSNKLRVSSLISLIRFDVGELLQTNCL